MVAWGVVFSAARRALRAGAVATLVSCAVIVLSTHACRDASRDAAPLEPIREAFHAHLPARGFHPEPDFVIATLGNDAGMVGAADLARTALGAVPGVAG